MRTATVDYEKLKNDCLAALKNAGGEMSSDEFFELIEGWGYSRFYIRNEIRLRLKREGLINVGCVNGQWKVWLKNHWVKHG